MIEKREQLLKSISFVEVVNLYTVLICYLLPSTEILVLRLWLKNEIMIVRRYSNKCYIYTIIIFVCVIYDFIVNIFRLDFYGTNGKEASANFS